MFESDDKNRYLRRKHNKKNNTDNQRKDQKQDESSNDQTDGNMKRDTSSTGFNDDLNISDSKPNNTIYGELKLSTQLLERIRRLEVTNNKLKGELEKVTKEKDDCLGKFISVKKSILKFSI